MPIKSILCIILFTSLSIEASQKDALQQALTKVPATAQTDLPQAPAQMHILKEVYQKASENLSRLESMIRIGQYGEALTLSKNTLDEIRQRSGIDPKAIYREKIAVTASSLNQVSYIGTTFQTLDIDSRDTISLAVARYKEGLFLDILNQVKRTNLIYLRAFYQTLKMNGPLLQRDISKIRDDLLNVYAIPLYIRDTNRPGYFLVYDFEVANSDQNYLFNRELTNFMFSVGGDLQIRNEADFDLMLSSHLQQARTLHWAQQPKPVPQMPSNPYEHPSFKSCFDKRSESISENQAVSACETNYLRFDYTTESFNSCFHLRSRSISANQAVEACD